MTEPEYKAEIARLQELVRQLSERVAICSELLGKKAEKKPLKCYLMERKLGRKCEGA